MKCSHLAYLLASAILYSAVGVAQTFTNYVEVDPLGVGQVSLAIDQLGNPQVLAGHSGLQTLRYSYFNGTNFLADDFPELAGILSLAISASNTPAMSTHRQSTDTLDFRQKQGNSWGATETTDQGGLSFGVDEIISRFALDGSYYVSYYTNSAPNSRLARRDVAGNWSVRPAPGADFRSAFDVGADGVPRILISSNIFQILLVEDLGGPLSGQDIINGSLPGMTFDYGKDIAIDATARIHVSLFATGPTPSLVYGVRTAGVWSFEVVDTNNVGQVNHIAVGPDGTPYIIYMQANGTMQLAYKIGNTWTLEPEPLINIAYSVGAQAGLDGFRIDQSGKLYYVYFDAKNNSKLMLASGQGVGIIDKTGPITSNVVANPNPLEIGKSATLSANVSDVFRGNHQVGSAEYSVDGGAYTSISGLFNSANVNVATVLQSLGSGVHTICVRGTDEIGNVGIPACTLLPVYDPNGAFTTGAGKVQSPPGALLLAASVAGPATFGFVSKYKPGKNTPDGNLEFQFQAGSINFKSTSMDWLVVTGEPRSIFHGTGTINGSNVCKFEVDAWDNSFQPGNLDAFGLKITACQEGGDSYNLPATPITNGSIVIHKN